MALETAKSLRMDPLVFGPAFLRGTWMREAEELGVKIEYVAYSMLQKLPKIFKETKTFWIADEVHYLKNPSAQRTHAFYSLLKSNTPEYFIGLTGTPVKNRVPDFWTLLAFCNYNPKNTSGKKLEGDLMYFKRFTRHFCKMQKMQMRGRWIEKPGGIKEERIEEFKSFLVDKMIRFKVADVLQDLPTMTRKIIDLGLKPDPKLDELFQHYMAGSKVDVTAKATSAVLKTAQTIEYVNMLLEENPGPLLIFTDHVASANALAVSLGTKAITGQTPMQERQDIVDYFQRGLMPLLIATIGSLSVGVTLTAASHVIFNDLSWTPADNIQAEKRIHRIGQKSACFAHYLDATATDRHIRKTLFEKMTTIDKVIT